MDGLAVGIAGRPLETSDIAVESGRARLVPVKVGGRNGVDAWIESGLAPGATVVAPGGIDAERLRALPLRQSPSAVVSRGRVLLCDRIRAGTRGGIRS